MLTLTSLRRSFDLNIAPRARLWVWACTIVSLSVAHTAVASTRSGRDFIIPLTFFAAALSMFALWPSRSETLRGPLLGLSHCVALIIHGLFQWLIAADEPLGMPCFPVALHLLCCMMPVSGSVHTISLFATLVIIVCVYRSLFFMVITGLLLLGSVGVTLLLSLSSLHPHQSGTSSSFSLRRTYGKQMGTGSALFDSTSQSKRVDEPGAMLDLAAASGSASESRFSGPSVSWIRKASCPLPENSLQVVEEPRSLAEARGSLSGGDQFVIMSPKSPKQLMMALDTRSSNLDNGNANGDDCRASLDASCLSPRSLIAPSGGSGGADVDLPGLTTPSCRGSQRSVSTTGHLACHELKLSLEIMKEAFDRQELEKKKLVEEVAGLRNALHQSREQHALLKASMDRAAVTRALSPPKFPTDMLRDIEAGMGQLPCVVMSSSLQELASRIPRSTSQSLDVPFLKCALDRNVELRRKAEDDCAKMTQQCQEQRLKYEMLKSLREKDLEGKKLAVVNQQYLSVELGELTARYEAMKESLAKEHDARAHAEEQVLHYQRELSELKAKADLPEGCIIVSKASDASLGSTCCRVLSKVESLDQLQHSNSSLEQSLAFELSNGASSGERSQMAEMNAKYLALKSQFDQIIESQKKQGLDVAHIHREKAELKAKYESLKKTHDQIAADKAEADMVVTEAIEEATQRYNGLKMALDTEMETAQTKLKELQDQKEKVMELESINAVLKTALDNGENAKKKYDADFSEKERLAQEFKIKYEVLKESYDENVLEQQATHDERAKERKELMEVKRKVAVMKVRFDDANDKAEKRRREKQQQAQVSKELKRKYDDMKQKWESDVAWKARVERELESQAEHARKMEELYSSAKVRLDQKAQQCAEQEEKIAMAASHIKVIGWMNSGSGDCGPSGGEVPEEKDEDADWPDILPRLTTLHQQPSDVQSGLSVDLSENVGETSTNMSNISHDVKTPLTSALSALMILLDENVKLTETDKRDLLQKAFNSLQTVLGLVNSILDFEKLRVKAIVPQWKQLNIRRLAIGTIRNAEGYSAQNGMEFILNVAPSVPTFLMGDRLLLQRVLGNLICNAIKASPDSTNVAVHLRWDSQREILIGAVIGHWSGPLTATRCAESDRALSRGAPNLRLAVCNQLLTEMGGSLSVFSSETGQESVFEFQLPAPLSKHVVNTLALPVKVIDDDRLRYSATVSMLEYAGATVLRGMSLQLPPAVVFLTPSSTKSWESMRPFFQAQKVPVCAVIPNHLPMGTPQFYGVDVVMRSPIDITELRDVLNQYSETSCNHSDTSRSSSHGTFISSAISDVKKEDVFILLVEDIPVNHNLFTRQLYNMGYTNVHGAYNGQEALDLAEKNKYHLIIMDCQMPIMDGFEATRRIRQLPQHQYTPIAGLTADHSSANIERCHASGMSEVFTKPISTITWKSILEMGTKRAASSVVTQT